VLWSGNLKKEFWLISGCCETAAIVDITEKSRNKELCVYVWVCICFCFVMCSCVCLFCNMWACVCVCFVMCGRVYLFVC